MQLRKIERKNKKGSIQGLFLMLVALFSLGIFILIMVYVIPEITDALRNSALNESSSARVALTEADNLMDKLDPIFLFIFVGLLMGMLITSFMIESHPIFIPVFIFLVAFALVIGAVMSNIYEDFSEDNVLSGTAADQTYTNAILDNYVMVILGVGLLSMIIIFARMGSLRGGGTL